MLSKQRLPHNQCAVIINSCDAYSDIWPLFCAAFKEHWRGCPYPLLINTESLNYSDTNLNIRTHVHGKKKDSTWGERLLGTLGDLSSEYIVMLFDDFVLEDKVDEKCIEECMRRMDADKNISVFYFSNIPGDARKASIYDGFEIIPRFTNYRLNSAPALWRRQHLIELTRAHDDPWMWELFGTSRTFLHRGVFYCAQRGRETIYKYNSQMGGAIYRGKWVEKVAGPLIERYGLGIDMKSRGTIGEPSSPRTFSQKLKMIVQGFRTSGLFAIVIIFLLIRSKYSTSGHVK